MAVITLEKNSTITTFKPPPSDFDPLTASPSDLARFGFPARPSDPHLLARFQSVFSRLSGKLQYIVPTFHVDPTRSTHIQPGKDDAGTETYDNWSGGVIYAPKGQSFKWVQGDWIVPNVAAPTKNQAYYCANWIGMDGDGSGDVCQAGMTCQVAANGQVSIYPWHEWYPSSWVNITNMPVSAGDMVTVMICTQGAGSTSASISFVNNTTGLATSYTITAPAGTKLAGNSAEWIVETPVVGGALTQMPDYGQVFFSSCEAGLSNNNTVNGGTGNNINLVQNGKTVSTGTLISPTIIQCQYAGPEP